MSGECVRVMVRCRPMNSKEKANSSKMCVQVDQNSNQITLFNSSDTNDNQKLYTYDNVFASECSQQYIYEQSAFQLVESVFEGYNGTIFAYGQTGCGKTFTMMGEPSDDEMKGIIPRTFQHIINVIESEGHKEFLVRCSYIEIYNEEIHDLLSKDVKARYELKESPDEGVFIKDLNKRIVKSVSEMEQLMIVGNKNRSTGETAMNKDSSRSHSIFTIYVEVSEVDSQGEQHFRAGKLNLVDLAGSERQSKTQATGDRLKEANKINLSLSALGNVISALVDGKSQHVPYRDSKLTRLLQDSLGGNTKTIMIAAISPADFNYDETVGTLRYASRAKKIKNKPKINEDPKDALLREYADEINRLKNQLQNGGGAPAGDKDGEQAEKWKEAHEMLSKDKERMEKELRDKNELAEKEKEQRLQMEQLLEEYQKNKLVGGKGDEEEKKAYQEMKKKMKKQLKEHEKLVQENKKKEEEMMEVEKNYQNLQEEVEAQRKIIRKLKAKFKQSQCEIEDLVKEKNDEKEELLSSVRIFEKENQLQQAILEMAFKKEEIDLIKTNTEWSDTKNGYVVVPFLFKNKELRLPKLPFGQAMEQVDAEKDSRAIQFERNRKDTSPIQHKKEGANGNSSSEDYFNNEDNSTRTKTRKIDHSINRSRQGQKRQLIDMTNNIPPPQSNQKFSTANYSGQTAKEEDPKPKRNINGIQLNPLQHNTSTALSTNVIKYNNIPFPQEARRNPKTQPLLPLNMSHSNSKSVES